MGTASEKYDRQLIVMIEPDENIRALRKAIVEKNTNLKTDIVWTQGFHPHAPERWAEYLTALTNRSRLYLLGHGNWSAQTLGGAMAGEVNGFLKSLRAVKLVSCAGCASARTTADKMRIDLSHTSFVTRLHELLYRDTDGPKLKTVMFGRVFSVVAEAGQTYKLAGERGQMLQHHRAASKVRLSWDGNRQKIEWVDYTDATEDDEVTERRNAIPQGGGYLT